MFAKFRPLFALFTRSLREQARTKFTSASRAGIGLILLLFIGSTERSLLSNPAPGMEVLTMLAMVNFFVITIFGLSTFPSAITEEKEEDTLGQLRMTQLNPLAILLGKSTARLFDGFLLLAVQLPFTMLCITLGGVHQSQILRIYGILSAYLFLLCNIGLLWSVICRRTKWASMMTLGTGIAIYVLPLFLLALGAARWTRSAISGQARAKPWFQIASEWCLSINPVADLFKTMFPRGGGFPFPVNSMLPGVILGVLSFGLAWLLFDLFCSTTGEAVPSRTPKSPGVTARRRAGYSRPGRFAIAWKDFHFLNGGFRGTVVRLAVYGGLTGAFLLWYRTMGWQTSTRAIGEALRVCAPIALGMEVGLTASRIFGVERQRKTLGSLFALPCGTSGMIRQKVLGALPVFIPSLAFYAAGLILIANSQARRGWVRIPDFSVSTAFIVASVYVLFGVIAAYLSLRMRRAVFASAVALMFFGSIFAGLLFREGGVALVILWVVIAVVASAIPRRIAASAAEE